MGSDRPPPDRRGATVYLGVLVTALLLIALFAALRIQLDQQLHRVRVLKATMEALFLARHGLELYRNDLERRGTVDPTRTLSLGGGEISVWAQGPRPPGSKKYLVFSQARFARVAVSLSADLTRPGTGARLSNLRVHYQGLDLGRPDLRLRIEGERKAAVIELRRTLMSYRAEGAQGLRSRLDSFLGTAAGGTIPAPDRGRILSQLPSRLTTAVP